MHKRKNEKKLLLISVFLAVMHCLSCPVKALSWQVTQVTDNNYDDYKPEISGSNYVWQGYDGYDLEVFYWNASGMGEPCQVTDNSYFDYPPQISGSNVVWHAQDGITGSDTEIFFWDAFNMTEQCQITANSYYDENPYPGMETYNVCYQVTSVWESETDYCESMPAASVVPIYDFVCVDVTSINNSLEGGLTALYPNPASDRVTITSSVEMSAITIVNYVGQVIYRAELNDVNSIDLNTGNYDAGVYVVRLDTENGIVTKRMAIAK